MKRGYTHIKALEAQLKELRSAGKTCQAIADELGLNKKQIKNWINRENRAKAKLEAGISPRQRGRPRKHERTSEDEYKFEIKRLKMENQLLRDFLRHAGKR